MGHNNLWSVLRPHYLPLSMMKMKINGIFPKWRKIFGGYGGIVKSSHNAKQVLHPILFRHIMIISNNDNHPKV